MANYNFKASAGMTYPAWAFKVDYVRGTFQLTWRGRLLVWVTMKLWGLRGGLSTSIEFDRVP